MSLPGSLINDVSSWPTASQWHYFISLPGSLTDHAPLSYDQQYVGDTTLFLCQVFSSFMSSSHGQQEVSDWFISLPGSLISHVFMTNSKWVALFCVFAGQLHQSCLITCLTVGEYALLICQSQQSWLTSLWQQHVSDTALCFFQAVSSILIPWQTASEWHCFISLPGSLLSHVPSHEQQDVSAPWLYVFARQSH